MNAWDNLPNAKHIDWVIASVKSNIDEWDAAWDAARDAAWDAAAALVAYDHSAKYLAMTYDQLCVWYELSEDPAALLLLPAVKAKELIDKKHQMPYNNDTVILEGATDALQRLL